MDIIGEIIKREGGFVDHPSDKGGPTNFGITLRTLRTWRGQPVTREDVRTLTKAEARQIYAERYIQRPKFDKIADARLREHVIDCGVLSGPRTAAKWLQKAAGVTDDGAIGPLTLAAVNGGDTHTLNTKVAVLRIRSMGRIMTRDHSQAAFALGWLRRATKFLLPV